MIEIKNVTKCYSKNVKVIENLDLKINDGEIFGFIGANGAGKTTTIKMITGILNITNGDIYIDGKSISKEPIEAKEKLGLVPDDPNIFLQLKGIEYLNFVADIYNVSTEKRNKDIEELAKRFEIYDSLNERLETYSHGMRQKIMIISTLIHSPQNWILDEPLTGLDPKASYELKKIMKEYSQNNKCVFFSTHILDVAEKLCSRVAIIKKGELVKVGTMKEVKGDKSLENVFMELEG